MTPKTIGGVVTPHHVSPRAAAAAAAERRLLGLGLEQGSGINRSGDDGGQCGQKLGGMCGAVLRNMDQGSPKLQRKPVPVAPVAWGSSLESRSRNIGGDRAGGANEVAGEGGTSK